MATDLVAFKAVGKGTDHAGPLSALRDHAAKKHCVRDETDGGFSFRPKQCFHRVFVSAELANVGKPTDLLICRARMRMGPVAKAFTLLTLAALGPLIIGLFIVPNGLAESRKLCRKAFDDMAANALPAIA